MLPNPTHLPSQVTSLDVKDGRVTGAACSVSGTADPQQQQRFAADAVVLAAGVGVPDLASQLGYELPLLHKPAAIVLTRALQPGLLRHMLVTDTVFILQVNGAGQGRPHHTVPECAAHT
jgi:glycine/D-amino acid oxidase-like deaminating enzyme